MYFWMNEQIGESVNELKYIIRERSYVGVNEDAMNILNEYTF